MEDVCTQVQTDAFILPKSEFREIAQHSDDRVPIKASIQQMCGLNL